MAKVSMQLAHGELISPFGAHTSLPVGMETHRHVDECYWMARVHGVTVKWDSPEEEARAKELEALEVEGILRFLPAPQKETNGNVTCPELDLYDHPVIFANPQGLLKPYSRSEQELKVVVSDEQLKRVVAEVLAEAGITKGKKPAAKEEKAFEV